MSTGEREGEAAAQLRMWMIPGALALGVVGLHLACGEHYGFFRDELYFVACGKHLAWGYVDQPPMIAAVARVGWWLSGEGTSVLRFRLLAALSNAATVLLGAGIARRLGGGRFGCALAALLVAVAPIQLAQGHLLTMNTLELSLWAAIAWTALVAAEGAPRVWVLVGGLLGLALLTKYTAVFLAFALMGGLLLTRGRQHLRSPWLWVGVGVAGVLALPSALWQLQHWLPFLELLRNGRAYKNASIPLPQLLFELVGESGAMGLLLALGGLGWVLLARGAVRVRFVGVTAGLLLVGLSALHAKPYYFAPVMTPLFAAGAVAAEKILRGLRGRGLAVGLIVLTTVPELPLLLPVLPLPAMLRWQAALGVSPTHLEKSVYSDVPQHFADQLGWRERVRAVAAVASALPAEDRARAVIFTTNYGRAAALELLSKGFDLPPVTCGHNQYFLWGVPGTPQVVIALGGAVADYRRDFAEVTLAGRTPVNPFSMPYESDTPIYVLRFPRAPVATLFLASKHFE